MRLDPDAPLDASGRRGFQGTARGFFVGAQLALSIPPSGYSRTIAIMTRRGTTLPRMRVADTHQRSKSREYSNSANLRHHRPVGEPPVCRRAQSPGAPLIF